MGARLSAGTRAHTEKLYYPKIHMPICGHCKLISSPWKHPFNLKNVWLFHSFALISWSWNNWLLPTCLDKVFFFFFIPVQPLILASQHDNLFCCHYVAFIAQPQYDCWNKSSHHQPTVTSASCLLLVCWLRNMKRTNAAGNNINYQTKPEKQILRSQKQPRVCVCEWSVPCLLTSVTAGSPLLVNTHNIRHLCRNKQLYVVIYGLLSVCVCVYFTGRHMCMLFHGNMALINSTWFNEALSACYILYQSPCVCGGG